MREPTASQRLAVERGRLHVDVLRRVVLRLDDEPSARRTCVGGRHRNLDPELEAFAGFAFAEKGVTRVTVGFRELLGSLEPMSPDVQTNPKFNDTEDEIKNMQPTK